MPTGRTYKYIARGSSRYYPPAPRREPHAHRARDMKAVMNEAELYQSSNVLQKRDALECLEEYSLSITWKYANDRVLDIGCGDGSVTTDILSLYLPENYSRLVGCDISERMVQHAREHHKGERCDYMVLDIEAELPPTMRATFDHVFSFYTLHWIRHQEKAFTNIYDLLAPGGDCLLLFLGHMPVFDVYRIISQSPKWSSWIKNVENYISPYHDSQEPEKEVKRMMEKIGFTNVEVSCKERLIRYDKLDTLKKAVMAVNPFGIPKELHEDFLEDYVDVLRDLSLIDDVNNNEPAAFSVKCNYNIIVAFGRKEKTPNEH